MTANPDPNAAPYPSATDSPAGGNPAEQESITVDDEAVWASMARRALRKWLKENPY